MRDVYHVSCSAKKTAERGPATVEDHASLPRNRLTIQHIAARYLGRRRAGCGTFVLLLIVFLKVSICFDMACEVYYTSACFGKEGLLIGRPDAIWSIAYFPCMLRTCATNTARLWM
ncbi:MAG: hypothetical protein DMG76_26025 [Acidobacteria bacterium]|nr:MAG: hypothetical protein DMG76_26025 [Acidobacteriota bacterium]